jgi:hypothetical protein
VLVYMPAIMGARVRLAGAAASSEETQQRHAPPAEIEFMPRYDYVM